MPSTKTFFPRPLAQAARTAFFCAAALGASLAQGAEPVAASTLVIAPMIEGFGYCQAGSGAQDFDSAIGFCTERKDWGVKELKSAIDVLEPGGAKGAVQVGYTVGINLLSLKQRGAQAVFERFALALKTIDRPMVLHLFANHFASTTMLTPLGTESMAKFADQTAPQEKYFGGGIAPLTLDMSPGLEVNRIRREALAMVGDWYGKLPDASKKRIAAITMAGELHHFYDDFSTGMGRYENIRVTDYSPGMVATFQKWLEARHGSIGQLNKQLGGSYLRFSDIQPPSASRRKKFGSLFEYFDSYAHGIVPVDGWMERLPEGHSLKVLVDGEAVGTAEYGLNRQDVYEAIDSLATSQVGFRYWLDFSKLSRGGHVVQVVVDGPQGYELAKRDIVVLTGDARPRPGSKGPGKFAPPPPNSPKAYLDLPANQLTLHYNPLAREWLAFRGDMVTQAYNGWFDQSVANGLPAEKLYTHQIAAGLFGGWNPVLFASDPSLQGPQRYKKGINLYGGSASMALLRRHYVRDGEPFGVPEFHPQAWKDPAFPMRALQDLQKGGAVFVSPYFLSMAPDRFRHASNAHNKFRVFPDNKDFGSDHLYRAIVEMAKQ